MFPGWINFDILDLSQVAQQHGMTFQKLDIRQGIPLPDASCKAVYSCHNFEHLNPWHELLPVLKDCKRLLQPGGVCRIVVPDLALLAKGYQTNDWSWLALDAQPERFRQLKSSSLKFSMIAFGGDDPSYRRENWGGHMGLYDFSGLKEMATLAGFDEDKIVLASCNHSEHPALKEEFQKKLIYDMWPDHSLVVEAWV